MAKPLEIHRAPLSRARYKELQRILDEWEADLKRTLARHPRKAYLLGGEQIVSFLRLVGKLGQTDLPPSGATGPTTRLALEWLRRYTMHEFDGALDRYLDSIKSGVLYGLQGAANPTEVATWLYKATRDAEVNWRTVARTEMQRANAAGRLDALANMGYEQVWAPKHAGACQKCRRLLEGQVFDLEQVRHATNYGRPAADWIACIPLHPQCRHVWLPYIKDLYEESQREYQALDDNGLDDKTLDEMFDSSGQIKPEYANDPRLKAFFEQAGKTIDPLEFALGIAVAKTARAEEPPGLHHTSGRRNCGNCEWYETGECRRYNRPVDADELCRSWEPNDLGKAYFDNDQGGLDPLLWEGLKLRSDVRHRLVDWWRHALAEDAPLWSRLFLTGSACRYNWGGRSTPHDLDAHLLIDYPALRAAHPEYATLSDPELHAALVTQVKASLDQIEAAPGLKLDGYVRTEHLAPAFAKAARAFGNPTYDVQRAEWIVPPRHTTPLVDVEDGGEILDGEGAQLAQEHPAWLQEARRLRQAMQDTLDRGALDQADLAQLREAYEYVHQLRSEGHQRLGEFLWQYLKLFGPLARVKHLLHDTPMEKVWPGYTLESEEVAKTQPVAAGTEHWITVHPHGEDEKGIPVLIRENGDGTARVIGGAGGHLDFLRISHQGRMKDDGKPKDRQEAAQATSEDEAAQQRAAHEQAAEKAGQVRERAQSELKESQSRVEGLVRELVNQNGVTVAGEQKGWDDLEESHRKALIKQAVQDSLYQSTYGQSHDLRRSQAPAGPIVVTPAPKDAASESSSSEEREPRESTDEEKPDTKPATRLRIAMPTEQADLLQEEIAGAGLLRKRVREANRIIGGGAKPTDATNLEWEPLDRPAAAQRRAAEVARQEVNRSLLGELDRAQGKTDTKKGRRGNLVDQGVKRGAFDAYDSLTYSVFGKTLLPTGAQELLGVNGTAQLLAHELQQRAANGEINLKQVQQTLDEITDERQQRMLDLDLNRARNAAREAASMGEEYAAGAKGESLFTRTSAKSRQTKKIREAANALGMAVGSCEALHTLRAILRQPVENVKVDGYSTPAQIKDMASKAGVHVTDRDIIRNAAGNYSLKLNPERMADMLDVKPDRDDDLRSRLEKIRTGEDLDREIEDARHPPGYARTLDRVQAQGSMFLQAAGSGVLAFAPGVGKTDTAIAGALSVMAKKPGSRVLIVAPKTALAGAWAKTIQKAAPGKSLQIMGMKGPEHAGVSPDEFDWEKDSGNLSSKRRAEQGQTPADFNIISFDTLKRNPELVKALGHNIVITDEAQYAKNPNSQRLEGIDKAAEGTDHRWALTGTPVEKKMDDLHTLLNWAKPGHYGGVKSFKDRFDSIGQYDHLATQEKVQQFRESVSDGVFYQSQNASNMPAFPDMKWEDAPLSEGHQAVYQDAVNDFNQQWQERHDQAMDRSRRRDAGEPVDEQPLPPLPSFGGRGAQEAALMKPHQRGYHGPNARVNKVADLIAENPSVKFGGFQDHPSYEKGAHAGTYAPKSLVFGRETQPLEPLRDELERRGTHKVFFTHGNVPEGNDKVLRDFMEHDGPAVLITSDTNKTARSLQFGDNSGSFQHGATQVIHTDIPQNNADLQQRVARAWRRGAQAPVSHHMIYSDTPVERAARDQLSSELRTQEAVGNPEDKVSVGGDEGRETIGQKLKRGGQQRLGRRKRDTPDTTTPAGTDTPDGTTAEQS